MILGSRFFLHLPDFFSTILFVRLFFFYNNLIYVPVFFYNLSLEKYDCSTPAISNTILNIFIDVHCTCKHQRTVWATRKISFFKHSLFWHPNAWLCTSFICTVWNKRTQRLDVFLEPKDKLDLQIHVKLSRYTRHLHCNISLVAQQMLVHRKSCLIPSPS